MTNPIYQTITKAIREYNDFIRENGLFYEWEGLAEFRRIDNKTLESILSSNGHKEKAECIETSQGNFYITPLDKQLYCSWQETDGIVMNPVILKTTRQRKFRTMKTTEHYHKGNLDPDQLDKNGKLKIGLGNGHKIPAIGQFMRKYNLDELPQLPIYIKDLFLELTGLKKGPRMRLIGPRPRPIKQWFILFPLSHMELAMKYCGPCLININEATQNRDFSDLVKNEFDFLKKLQYADANGDINAIRIEYGLRVFGNKIFKGKKSA